MIFFYYADFPWESNGRSVLNMQRHVFTSTWRESRLVCGAIPAFGTNLKH